MKYTYLNYAYDVLQKAGEPMTVEEIWNSSLGETFKKKLDAPGKTPKATLAARLYVDIKENKNSIFFVADKKPTRFFLKTTENPFSDSLDLEEDDVEETDELEETDNVETTDDLDETDDLEESSSEKRQLGYHEQDLYPVISVYIAKSFKQNKSIYTKTISHEVSKKKGYNQWVYPDLVGFYMPLKDWEDEVIELNRISDNNALQFFSFEVKKFINKTNYRKSFFQAVSNSSWAHEGYLVAAKIDEDDDLKSELIRLSKSFGIGIIQLNLSDIYSSFLFYPARQREVLDWETINKLCELNRDFQDFIKNVQIDYKGKRIDKSFYNRIDESVLEDFEMKQK